MRGVKGPAAQRTRYAAVGAIGEPSECGRLKFSNDCSPEKGLPAEVAMAGVLSCAKRVSRNVRPMSLGKKRVNAPEEHGGVWVQSPTQGLQR